MTRILAEFAATKSSARTPEVQGPSQEGSNFRWRIISNRYKEVTVVAATKKPLFGKAALSGIEVFGMGGQQDVATQHEGSAGLPGNSRVDPGALTCWRRIEESPWLV